MLTLPWLVVWVFFAWVGLVAASKFVRDSCEYRFKMVAFRCWFAVARLSTVCEDGSIAGLIGTGTIGAERAESKLASIFWRSVRVFRMLWSLRGPFAQWLCWMRELTDARKAPIERRVRDLAFIAKCRSRISSSLPASQLSSADTASGHAFLDFCRQRVSRPFDGLLNDPGGCSALDAGSTLRPRLPRRSLGVLSQLVEHVDTARRLVAIVLATWKRLLLRSVSSQIQTTAITKQGCGESSELDRVVSDEELTIQALDIIDGQLPNNTIDFQFVWVPNWGSRFARLGRLREFLSRFPDNYELAESRARGFEVRRKR